ncbi:hypothetical protein [Candidatus Nitrospira neomarina]|uniref:Uncharacterized protein n=1 Tax=Candidatus Nitrospira neomarina TaxID=3020899 RepID=A0AA96K2D0_9BACT|nr:hypothetical protein [Candidatus Nitrospira neomarina]WNM64006.1 hypothetical protein PQG83_09695 [Candidatus Nitrospira neomarina]
MVILRCLRRRRDLLVRLFSPDGRHDLSKSCKAFHALKLFLAVEQHRPQLTLEHRAASGAFDLSLAVPDE